MINKRTPYKTGLAFFADLSKGVGGSFMSGGINGILCVGAYPISTRQGLLFNGANDYVNCTADARFANVFYGGGVAWVTAKVIKDGAEQDGYLLRKRNGWEIQITSPVGSKMKVFFKQDFDGNDGQWRTTEAVATIGQFNNIAVSYNSDESTNNPVIIVNRRVYKIGDGLTKLGNPVGSRISDAASVLWMGNSLGAISAINGYIKGSMMSQEPKSDMEIVAEYDRMRRTCG